MSPSEYRDAIKALGLSLTGAGRLFGANERTSRRWAADDSDQNVPRPVAICLRLMERFGLKAADVETILTEKDQHP